MMKKHFLVFGLLLGCCARLACLSLGSLTLVNIYSTLQTFPRVPILSDNEIIGFAWLKGGFEFEDHITSMTFRGLQRQSGPFNFYGGFFTLEQDLFLGSGSTMPTFGSVFGGGYMLDLAATITWLAAPPKGCLIKDLTLLLSSDLTVSGTIRVRGSCLIDGRGSNFTLNNVATIIVDANATLTLKNMTIRNQYGGKIQINSSAIGFNIERCSFDLDDNYQLSKDGIVLIA
jgi:hypothetical protein